MLERANLITRSREAQRRPCRLEAVPLKAAAEWIGTYREFWEESFDRLDQYLAEVQSKENKRDRRKRKEK